MPFACVRAMSCLAGALVAAWLATAPASAQPRFRFDTTPGRLSKDVVPVHLRLALDLDPARDTFEGRADYELRLRKAAPEIELHAHELVALEAWLEEGPKRRRTLNVQTDAEARTWRLVPTDGRPIASGSRRLLIAYRGQVQRQGEALFRAPAIVAGQSQPTLATQLEPIHARRVFPAFDEPVFRPRFELTVRAPAEYEVLNNMPRLARRVEGTTPTITHRFAPTPPMPSYLFSVAVGRYDVLEGRAAGVPLRILTAPGKAEQGRYALEATQRLLPYYTQYFGVPYALPRLDQLAVPSTRWGAMEDWGLISYGESFLLVNPATTGPAQRRWIYDLIAHEVAHQWFGNLVSAASWSEIWLSEAFATWMARKATHRFNPDWQTPLNMRSAIEQTMALDATEATRAIRSGPVRETAVLDVFDNITYEKGGAVLTMIEQWLGETTFRRGLAAYMRDRRMSGATAGDLWHHIGHAAGRDVAAMAASWTDQIGFPLVTMHTRCEGGSTRVELSQRRFVIGQTGQTGQTTSAPARWQIPVRLAHGLRESTVMLAEENAHVTLPGCDTQPVRANAAGLGFYRVAYAPEAHAALRERFTELPAADRMALLADALAFIREGSMPVSELPRWLALPVTVQDAARGPLFKQAIDAFEWVDMALAGTPQRAAMREHARSLMAPELARLGWDPKDSDDSETLTLRPRLVRLLALMDDAATLAEALARALRDESGAQPLHASMRRPVRVAAGVSADRARFDRQLAGLVRADSEQERFTLAFALASGRDADRARELLDRMLEGDLPSNVAMSMPWMVAENSPYGELVYRHLLEHWPRWAEIAGQNGKRWLLPRTAESANDPARAKGLVEDQARLVGPDGALLAARAAAQIGQKVDLKSRAATLGP